MKKKESYTDKIHFKAILLLVFGSLSVFLSWLSAYFLHSAAGYFLLNLAAGLMSLYAVIIMIVAIKQIFKAHKEPYGFRKVFSIIVIIGYFSLLTYNIYQITQENLAKEKTVLEVDV